MVEPPPMKLVDVDWKGGVFVRVHVERVGEHKVAILAETQKHMSARRKRFAKKKDERSVKVNMEINYIECKNIG